jgi:hypothetical protein
MTLTDFRDRFEKMPKERKIQLLALMAMALTVETRSKTIDLPPAEATEAYRGFNEMQHSLANQLLAYLTPKGNARPSDLFWDSLENLSDNLQLQENFLSAVKWAFSRE